MALAFAITHPGVTFAILGPRTMEQLEDALAGAEVPLGDDVVDQIDAIVDPGTESPSAWVKASCWCQRRP
jgi:aryl-alcohol dehydrogenase-like predicted oxidoreductase